MSEQVFPQFINRSTTINGKTDLESKNIYFVCYENKALSDESNKNATSFTIASNRQLCNWKKKIEMCLNLHTVQTCQKNDIFDQNCFVIKKICICLVQQQMLLYNHLRYYYEYNFLDLVSTILSLRKRCRNGTSSKET